MAVSVPASVLAELTNSADKGYLNRQKSILLARAARPMLDFWLSNKKVVDMGQGAVRVGLVTPDSGDNQGWTNFDALGFTENQPTLGFEFGVYNIHRGLLMGADYLMNAGFEVDFNSASKSLAEPLSASEKTRLRQIVSEKVDNFRDAAQNSLDRDLHLDGTIDTKRPIGLDAMLPLNYSGTYGGVARSNTYIQHYYVTGATYTAAGNLEEYMNTAFWQAKLNSRGQKRGAYRIICGRAFADRYRRFFRNNNAYVMTEAGGTPKLDLNISDSGLRFMGISLEIDPTLAVLDALYAPAVPFDRRCYILCEDTFVFGLFNKSDWSASFPQPTASERAIRMSLDWRVSPFCTNPNANAVVAVAA